MFARLSWAWLLISTLPPEVEFVKDLQAENAVTRTLSSKETSRWRLSPVAAPFEIAGRPVPEWGDSDELCVHENQL